MSFPKRRAKVRAVFSPQILESAYLSRHVSTELDGKLVGKIERYREGRDLRISRINIIIFLQRKRMIIRISLRETYPVGCLGTGD